MKYAKPNFSRSKVDQAGEVLRHAWEGGDVDDASLVSALQVMNNWRSSHAFPLNTVTVSLKKLARSTDPSSLIAQRLKRAPSILDKLEREKAMSLARMQDIGGCRAVVSTVGEVSLLRTALKASRMKHVLKREFDYIQRPKPSGYRGVHLIYRYNSDRNEIYNKLLIEVQIRSAIQHAWATAVETMGTFLKTSLKASQGPDEWLEFFQFASSAFARLEDTPRLHSSMTDASISSRLARKAKTLRVKSRLQKYGNSLRMVEQHPDSDARYFLMLLEPETRELTIQGYRASELHKANSDYLELERAYPSEKGYEVVLVAAESITLLRQAYPNYFLDTKTFLDLLDRAVLKAPNQRRLRLVGV